MSSKLVSMLLPKLIMLTYQFLQFIYVVCFGVKS